MYVWHGDLTCRHHWPQRPSGLHQPTVLGASRLGYPLTPQILPLTVNLPETWTGQNLPAAKGGKKEEVGDGLGQAASKILSLPQKMQVEPYKGDVEGWGNGRTSEVFGLEVWVPSPWDWVKVRVFWTVNHGSLEGLVGCAYRSDHVSQGLYHLVWKGLKLLGVP